MQGLLHVAHAWDTLLKVNPLGTSTEAKEGTAVCHTVTPVRHRPTWILACAEPPQGRAQGRGALRGTAGGAPS